jgi:hypothetical protein
MQMLLHWDEFMFMPYAISFVRGTMRGRLAAISAVVNSSGAFCAWYSLHRHAPATGRTIPWYPPCRMMPSSGYLDVSKVEVISRWLLGRLTQNVRDSSSLLDHDAQLINSCSIAS